MSICTFIHYIIQWLFDLQRIFFKEQRFNSNLLYYDVQYKIPEFSIIKNQHKKKHYSTIFINLRSNDNCSKMNYLKTILFYK